MKLTVVAEVCTLQHVERRLGHVPALDGLRGVALLMVVVGHTLAAVGLSVPGLVLGVDLFFVLSGFLITTLLLEEWHVHGEVFLRAFYVRRACRLLPALFTMLGIYLIVVAVAFGAGQDSRAHLNSALAGAGVAAAYVSNFAGAFHPVCPYGMHHLWSLALEEQFYLVWPIVLIALLRRGVSGRAIMKVLACLVLAIGIYRLALQLNGAGFSRLWEGPDTRADSLGIGCLAAVARSYGLVDPARLGCRSLARWLPLAIAVTATNGSMFIGPFAVCCAVVILAAVGNRESRTARAFSGRHLRYLGKISYGAYLWHLPLISAFGPLGALAVVPVAAISYRVIERPFLTRRHRLAAAAGTAGVPGLAAPASP